MPIFFPTAALGYALLALGPGAAFWAVFIAPKSFVSLLTVFSSFFWLTALLATAAALRLAGAPVRLLLASPWFSSSSSTSPAAASAYAPILIAAVLAEELVARPLFVAPMHERSVLELKRLAASHGDAPLSALDRVWLSLAWGFGHAACHGLFLYAYALPLAWGPGTMYAPQCPQMPVFLTGALASLGGGAALLAAAVVGLEAWSVGAGGGGAELAAVAPEAAAAAGGREAEAAAAAAAPPLRTRLRRCPGASARWLAAFLRSRGAWLMAPGWPWRVVFPPLVHLAVSLVTIAALYPGGGCVGASAAALAVGSAAGVVAAQRAILLVAAEDGPSASSSWRVRGGATEDEACRPLQLRTMGGANGAATAAAAAGNGVRFRSGGGGGSGAGGGNGNGGSSSNNGVGAAATTIR
jgi:hypothetical protein